MDEQLDEIRHSSFPPDRPAVTITRDRAELKITVRRTLTNAERASVWHSVVNGISEAEEYAARS